METVFAVGQPVYRSCPALLPTLVDVSATEGMPRLIFLVGAILSILMAYVIFITHQKTITLKMKAEFEEKDCLMNQIKERNCVIESVQNEKREHELHIKQLKEEMKSLEASTATSTTRKLGQTEAYWKKKVADKDESIAALKAKLKHLTTSWADTLAKKEKVVSAVMDMYAQLTSQVEVLCKEKCSELESAMRGKRAAEQQCTKWNATCEELKAKVVKWKAKWAEDNRKMCIIQESANTLAKAKACLEARMAEMEANIRKALLRSRPRLIDLHYFIVQRLPPASRPYASAFCFTLGLPVQLYSGDDKLQITAVFQKWLECGSCIPRTWGALLSAMKRDFCFEDIPAKWIEEITKDLIYGGIAALPTSECFCKSCHKDFSKEYECLDTEDESSGILEAKEQSGIPESEEMVTPYT